MGSLIIFVIPYPIVLDSFGSNQFALARFRVRLSIHHEYLAMGGSQFIMTAQMGSQFFSWQGSPLGPSLSVSKNQRMVPHNPYSMREQNVPRRAAHTQ